MIKWLRTVMGKEPEELRHVWQPTGRTFRIPAMGPYSEHGEDEQECSRCGARRWAKWVMAQSQDSKYSYKYYKYHRMV
jgi:hypothetical protein